MSSATPLQTLASKSEPLGNSTHAGLLLQRKCACGSPTSSLTGECDECKSKKHPQTKLAMGASNDPLEQEADRVADQVLAAPAHPAVSGAPPHIQRFTGQPSATADLVPASVDRVLASSGRPLEPELRQDMEQRFGHDFSRVRVHTDAIAAKSARKLNAWAYTAGSHLVFEEGQYAPHTRQGEVLLAHELTHVVQQRAAANVLQLASKVTAAPDAKVGQTSPEGSSFRVRVVMHLEKGPEGLSMGQCFGSSSVGAPENLNRPIYDAVQDAKRIFVNRHPDVLKLQPLLKRNRVEFTFEMSPSALRDEPSRRRQVQAISSAMRSALGAAREEEYPSKPELSPMDIAAKTQSLRERIQRVREGMQQGGQEQGAARSALGELAAFLAIAPPPDRSKWGYPDRWLLSGEKEIGKGNVETAKHFVKLAENALEGQQQQWEQYKSKYAFGDEVVSPVAWKVLQLFSFGLVDKALFEVSSEAAKEGVLHQLASVGKLLGGRVFAILTFGGGPPAYEAVVKYWEAHPLGGPWSTLAGGIVAGGEAAFTSILKELLPIQEMAIIQGVEIDPDTGAFRDPTVWERLEAFFSALLKIIDLGDTAKGIASKSEVGGTAKGTVKRQPPTRTPSGLQLDIDPQQPRPVAHAEFEPEIDLSTETGLEFTGKNESHGATEAHRRVETEFEPALDLSAKTGLELSGGQEARAAAEVQWAVETEQQSAVDITAESGLEVGDNELPPATEALWPMETTFEPAPDVSAESGLELTQRGEPHATTEAHHRDETEFTSTVGIDPTKKTGLSVAKAEKAREAVRKRRPETAQFGERSDEKAGSEYRKGVHFHEFNEAEVGPGRLRIDFDPALGGPRKVSFNVTKEALGGAQQTDPAFRRDETVEGAQPTGGSFGSGYDRAHLAPGEAFKATPEMEREVDLMTNIVPMRTELNQAGGAWREAELRTNRWAKEFGSVSVEIEVDYDSPPRQLPGGTRIPREFRRRVTKPNGEVLEDFKEFRYSNE